jgi:tripartite-type tricarboxylate transporter receptor subunit TctC
LPADIAPVAGPIVVPNVMVVHPSVPATTVPDFIAYAKASRCSVTAYRKAKLTAEHIGIPAERSKRWPTALPSPPSI